MMERDLAQVRDALVSAGITGTHRSHPRRGNIDKLHALVRDDVEATFGLSGIDRYSATDVLGFMSDLTGCPADIAVREGDDLIEPDRTIEAIVAGARRLEQEAERGASLLAVTGHPTGLLEHHIHVVDSYRRAGGKVLLLREDERFPFEGRRVEICYVGGVGCLSDGASLRHVHSSKPMEALLEAEPWPEIVLGDHGFAGAAIERGIPVVAVMDINDAALSIAVAEGRDAVVIPMDDNRLPHLYEPSWYLFDEILAGRAVDGA